MIAVFQAGRIPVGLECKRPQLVFCAFGATQVPFNAASFGQ